MWDLSMGAGGARRDVALDEGMNAQCKQYIKELGSPSICYPLCLPGSDTEGKGGLAKCN